MKYIEELDYDIHKTTTFALLAFSITFAIAKGATISYMLLLATGISIIFLGRSHERLRKRLER